MSDKFWKWLAGKLPRKLVLFAALRAVGAVENDKKQFTLKIGNAELLHVLQKWSEHAYSRRIRGHSQNLTDGKQPMWKHGRAWLYLWSKQIGLEWRLLSKSNDFSVIATIGGEESHQLQFHLALPYLCSIFLSFQGFLRFRSWRYWGVFGRDTGIKIHDGSLWISIWFNDSEVHFLEWPKVAGFNIHLDNNHGFMISFDPADFILGYSKHSKETLRTAPAKVVLPEGEYPVLVEIFESTWKRPRWPWPTKMIRANVDCGKDGIPSHAGKGENSWDLDDDLVFSMTCPETTPEAAAKRLADSIMHDRGKYGPPSDLLAKKAAILQ